MTKENPFDGLAERYQKNRPDYPDDLLAHLRESAATPQGLPKTLLDVGAGTGISTRAFRRALGPEWAMTGVEPGADMREQAIAATPKSDAISYLEGGAESLPAADGSLGVVIVAQAIQFFDRPGFYQESARALHSRGLLAIVQNNRDWRSSALLDAYETYAETHSEGYNRNYRDIDLTGELAALAWSSESTRYDHIWLMPMEPSRFVAMTLSRRTMKPAVAALGESKVEADLMALSKEHADDEGFVQIPYMSELFIARKK